MKNKPTKQNREHVVWSFHWFPKLFFSAFCRCWQNAIFDLVFEKEKERRLAFLFQPLGLPVFCLRICFWNKNRFQNWIILVAMPSPKNCCTSSVAVLNTSSLFLSVSAISSQNAFFFSFILSWFCVRKCPWKGFVGVSKTRCPLECCVEHPDE